MPTNDNTRAKWAKRLHAQLKRPGQGPVEGPYWIVLNMSQHKIENFYSPSFPFRHPTKQSAIAEAGRLASMPDKAGWRFGVFEFTGDMAKVEPVREDQVSEAV